MTEILLDAVIDTLKLVPFLFVTYWFMEWLEHKTGTKTQALIRRAGRLGPLFGGMLGVFPQCGFSAAAANLYSGGLVQQERLRQFLSLLRMRWCLYLFQKQYRF